MNLKVLFKAPHPVWKSFDLLKIALIMQFITFFMLVVCLQVSASTYAQKVTIVGKDIPLKKVFKDIRKQTGYNFIYSNKTISEAKPISLQVKNAEVKEVLDKAFFLQPLTYDIEDKIIIVKRKEGVFSSLPDVENQGLLDKAITGVVRDSATGEAIVGATIKVKGESKGTVTGADGKFSLEVEDGAVLEVSYLGYGMKEVVVNGRTNLNILLVPSTMGLSQLVVTALGIKREERALSYNAQQISSDEITKNRNANFINSLSSKVAGVTINASSSGIGGASRVVMRGAKSIDKSNNALYVIDGIPMLSFTTDQGQGQFASSGSTEGIADINPSDIENITVLTGAAAAALYGSSAANGAVLITTKKGASGKLKVSIVSNYKVGEPFVMPKFQNIYGSDGQISSWGAKLLTKADKYNPKDFFETPIIFSNTVTLSGGSDRNQVYLSVGSTNSEGLVPNNIYDRYNFSLRNTTHLLEDRLQIDGSAKYVSQNDNNMINQGEYMNPLVGAYLLPRGYGLSRAKIFEKYDPTNKIYVQNWGDFKAGSNGLYSGNFAGDFSLQNPYWVAYRNLRHNKRERYILRLGMKYDLYKWSETETWDINARVRHDNTNVLSTEKRYASTLSIFDMSKAGYYGQGNSYEKQTYADVISNFTKYLSTDHDFLLSANIGISIQDTRTDGMLYRGPLRNNGIPNVFNVFNIDQSAQKTIALPTGYIDQNQSVFGSLEFGYRSYLFLTLTGRNDWPSQLAGSIKSSFFYPSVGLSGVVTDMLPESMRGAIYPILSFLKVRSAYSSVGTPFPRWLPNPTSTIDEDGKVYTQVSYFPVGVLHPERTNSYEIGISSKWFNSKFGLDVTMYKTNTFNQTIFANISPSTGYDGVYYQTGNVENKGVEVGISYKFKTEKDFVWNTNLTMGYNENRIKSLFGNTKNPVTGEKETTDYIIKNTFGSLQFVLKEGGTLGDIYTNADFKRNQDGAIYVDKDGGISVDNYKNEIGVKIGSTLPKYNMGWSNSFEYKNISLGASVSGRIGGVVISMTQAALDQYGVSKVTANARDAGGVVINGFPYNTQKYYQVLGRSRLAQYYTYSATNFRLAEAYLSYTIEKGELWDFSSLTLSLTGSNLLMLYNKAPFDPELVSSSTGNYVVGLDYFMLPSLRTFGVSLKLNF